ncbi:MAG TPA: NAD-dependent epimerase, partial [Oligoflexia bacterium]|nr:NAD-dependent epimerase [Oligoflexia bacterium]
MKVLVTGVAGFVGFSVAKALLEKDLSIVGIDNLSQYYDPTLKKARLASLGERKRLQVLIVDISDSAAVLDIFKTERPDIVVHLAAQPGVRYSISHPHSYIQSNIVGFLNILEACRTHPVKHLIYASTSSVYGLNSKLPFSIHDHASHPISLYAATKRSNELMAHNYSHLFGIPSTGLRFFTVYGPWGRPDMSFFTFTKNILAGEPIEVFNEGRHRRDFTYIDDVVDSILKVIETPPPAPNPDWDRTVADPASSSAAFKIYNIGGNKPVELLKYIQQIEERVGKKAIKLLKPLQPGDLEVTEADISESKLELGYSPRVPLEEGISRFIHWYRGYYNI